MGPEQAFPYYLTEEEEEEEEEEDKINVETVWYSGKASWIHL